MQSYFEEKRGIESLGKFKKITLGEYWGTFKKIPLGEYRALREKGAPRAIPTMCVLTIKKDENLLPLRAKSCIVVLGNHEDRVWSKSDRFAPILRGDSLRFLVSLAVEKRCPLRQGNCKNAFCHGVLPPEETTIVRPPSGDPEADPLEYWLLLKTLYGLRRSPRHWHDKINAILLSISLTPSLEDPCLYSGFVTDPKDPSTSPSEHPLMLGLYVDDFVYFSEDPAVKSLFCRLLGERCQVDFIGIVEWFLGVHSLGESHRLPWPSILTNQDLLPTWLKASLVTLVTLLQRLLRIEMAFQSIPLLRLPMPMIRRLKFVAKRPIKVSLVVLVGWHIQHDQISQLSIPF